MRYTIAVLLVMCGGVFAAPGTLRGYEMYRDRASSAENIERELTSKNVPEFLVNFPFRRAWSELAEFGIMHDPDFSDWRKLPPSKEVNGRQWWAARVFLTFQQLDLDLC